MTICVKIIKVWKNKSIIYIYRTSGDYGGGGERGWGKFGNDKLKREQVIIR